MARVCVFGATGMVGSRVVDELVLRRAHEIVAVVHSRKWSGPGDAIVEAVEGDLGSWTSVRELAERSDVIVTAARAARPSDYAAYAKRLVRAARTSSAGLRILQCGGGGCLLDASGTELCKAPAFPAAFRKEALGQSAALAYFRSCDDVNWTYLSPPPKNFVPGLRTGEYVTGLDSPVEGMNGVGISVEDFAVALVDEIEEPRFLNARFTVGAP